MPFIIGVAFGNHDSSITIIKDGKIVGIYSEERFSRKKHDSSFPDKSLKYAINKHGIKNDEIESICYYEDETLKFKRLRNQFDDEISLAQYLCKKFNEGNLISPISKIRSAVKIPNRKISYVEHHVSHMFNSLALISKNEGRLSDYISVSLDGVGEMTTGSIYYLSDENFGDITKEIEFSYPDSLGLFYSAITSYLGFEINDAEFKVIGVASYGRPIFEKEFNKLLSYDRKEGIKLNSEYFDFTYNSPFPFKASFIPLLGVPAPKSTYYAEDFTTIENVQEDIELARYANIAASAQEVLTKITSRVIEDHTSNFSYVCYGGGVALNTKANYTLMKKKKLLISPDPGDGGNSLGAAAASYFFKEKKLVDFCTPYLGHDIQEDDINYELKNFPQLIGEHYTQEDQVICEAIKVMTSGGVIGWAQGKAEFGPRALGNRSILADPSKSEAQLYVNQSVKFREPFRPFAPAILETHLADLFDISEITSTSYTNHPLNYMLMTLPAKHIAYDLIPACIHVDGTSRVQVVTKSTNRKFYNLIESFYRQTGVPALLNTSFNLRGEPMVNNALDALNTFERSNMHRLFINNFSIKKIETSMPDTLTLGG